MAIQSQASQSGILISRRDFGILAGLVLTSAISGTSPAQAASKASAAEAPVRVYFIRGFMGIFSTGFDAMAKELTAGKVKADVYGHLSGSSVRSRIEKQYRQAKRPKPVILVGHSFGGNAAFQVAAGLAKSDIPVALVITVDPTRAGPLSANVKRYVNYFFPGNGLGASLKPRADVPRSRITNIDMRERADVSGAGDDHWTVTHNSAIQSEILKAVKRALR